MEIDYAAIKKAVIDYFGGPTETGAALGITREAVNQWRKIPVKRAAKIEKITKGRFKHKKLRPDIFGDAP